MPNIQLSLSLGQLHILAMVNTWLIKPVPAMNPAIVPTYMVQLDSMKDLLNTVETGLSAIHGYEDPASPLNELSA